MIFIFTNYSYTHSHNASWSDFTCFRKATTRNAKCFSKIFLHFPISFVQFSINQFISSQFSNRHFFPSCNHISIGNSNGFAVKIENLFELDFAIFLFQTHISSHLISLCLHEMIKWQHKATNFPQRCLSLQ